MFRIFLFILGSIFAITVFTLIQKSAFEPIIPKEIMNRVNSNQSKTIVFGVGVMIQQGKLLCNPAQEYGSHFNWLTLSWQRIQPRQDKWSWTQFDSWVDGYRNCGQEVAVHILSDASWAVGQLPENIRAMPPKDLNQYYTFVYEVAKHYQGKISRYAIENEAHAPENWGGTAEQYIAELQTAYKAIHAADPNAIVTDAGMSHMGLGYLTANWLISQGKSQQALNFANSYAAHLYRGNKPPYLNSVDEVKQLLSTPGVQKTISWYNLILENHQYYDHLQIHNGAPWQDLQLVLDYVHTNLQAQGDDKPLELWETWYSWTGAPGNGFNETEQAKEIIRFMVTAFSGQTIVYNYWLFTDYAIGEGHPGLVDNQGNPRPAAIAYKIASEKLNGSSFVSRLDLGGNINAYKFINQTKEVFVVWSTNSSPVNVRLPISQVKITDIQGNVTTADNNQILISDSPIFVERR
ncbi:MAG: endo-1,4-beta-xylanase [Candidatus Gottesmanbacteria bacterium]